MTLPVAKAAARFSVPGPDDEESPPSSVSSLSSPLGVVASVSAAVAAALSSTTVSSATTLSASAAAVSAVSALAVGVGVGASSAFAYELDVTVPIMVVGHALLGLIEGAITAAVYGYVANARPNLVVGRVADDALAPEVGA